MSRSFRNEFEGSGFLTGKPTVTDETHKKNWIDVHEYLYYQEHKDSVDKYGIKTEAMKMTKDEYENLEKILNQQNQQNKKQFDCIRYNIKHQNQESMTEMEK